MTITFINSFIILFFTITAATQFIQKERCLALKKYEVVKKLTRGLHKKKNRHFRSHYIKLCGPLTTIIEAKQKVTIRNGANYSYYNKISW